jgi:3-dehydroquinate synthase
MIVEARLAEEIGIAKPNLADTIQKVLKNLGLPIQIPSSIASKTIFDKIQYDKKRSKGEIRFALPEDIGKVQTGVVIQDLERLLEKL